jgi:hypothetical protein
MTDPGRLRRRRQFGLGLIPIALALVAIGVILAQDAGLVALLGLVALAQGIGLGVAAISLALGHNPLSAAHGHRPGGRT